MSTTGGLTTLHDTESVPTYDGLVERSDGNFYGADETRIFKMDPSGKVTTFHGFTSPVGYVVSTLLRASDDSLYGVAKLPGSTPGEVFRISDVASGPSIAALDPASGRAAGGASAMISGHHFREGASVTFDAQSAGVFFSREGLLTTVAPALPAGALYDVTVTNSDATTVTLPDAWFADFADVSGDNLFHDAIETVFRNGVTAGCGVGTYCPTAPVTRAQMAVFLLKAEHGSPTRRPLHRALRRRGLLPRLRPLDRGARRRGHHDRVWRQLCSARTTAVTRQQMAVFLLKTEYGPTYVPPDCKPRASSST